MRIVRHPAHPERVCWGCEKLCPADDLACGNGTIRAPHPIELFGPDWGGDDSVALAADGGQEDDQVPDVARAIPRQR
jgi:hypothetical protein